MHALWKAIEILDSAAFDALDRWDAWRKKDAYRKRVEKAVEHVRTPQKAITFDA